MNNKYFIPKKSHIEKKLANFDITNNVSYYVINKFSLGLISNIFLFLNLLRTLN